MNTYLLIKTLHILSSVLMVGTGFGSAFYLFFANRSGNPQAQAVVASLVVRADWWFTTPAVIAQPLTGWYLIHLAGWDMHALWLQWAIFLYLLAGACWLPVVWLQIKMKAMAQVAITQNQAFPDTYYRYARYWEYLGYPAFLAMLAVYFLMVCKPT